MIENVIITIDENIPEYMQGILRCESIVSYDENGNTNNHQDLIDNKEFHNENELLHDIAKKLGITTDIISIDR